MRSEVEDCAYSEKMRSSLSSKFRSFRFPFPPYHKQRWKVRFTWQKVPELELCKVGKAFTRS